MAQKIIGLGLLRGIAAFGIVGCHLALSPRDEWGWFATSFCDLNVGVFALISGFLMVGDGSCGWVEYIKKRASRILPTYFAWSAVFLAFAAVFQLINSGMVKPHYGSFGCWMRFVFQGSSSCHLWFLICLFYAQIVIKPIIRMKVGGWVWLGTGLCVLVMGALIRGWYGIYLLRMFAFLISGVGLRKLVLPPQRFAWIIFVCSIGIHIALRGILPAVVGDWIVSISAVIAFSGIHSTANLHGRTMIILEKTSMGVYLIHPILTAGVGVFIRKLFVQPFGLFPVAFDWVVCWLLSLLLTMIMQKISLASRFVR